MHRNLHHFTLCIIIAGCDQLYKIVIGAAEVGSDPRGPHTFWVQNRSGVGVQVSIIYCGMNEEMKYIQKDKNCWVNNQCKCLKLDTSITGTTIPLIVIFRKKIISLSCDSWSTWTLHHSRPAEGHVFSRKCCWRDQNLHRSGCEWDGASCGRCI